MRNEKERTKSTFEKALQLILLNKEEFSIKKIYNYGDKLVLLKPFAELVLTINVLFKHGYKNDQLEKVALWLWQEIDEGNELLNILSARQDLVILSCLYADFHDLGFKNNKLQNYIEYLASVNPISNLENPFWRKLDIQYSLDRLGILEFPNEPLKFAWINSYLPPWTVHNDLAYAITHEIFYVTDFGKRKDRLDLGIKKYIEKWLFSWLNIFLEQNNWDLIAEFLMVSKCIGFEFFAVDFYCLLINQQDAYGFIPSPPQTGSALIKESDSDYRKRFLGNYHTTLVAIMALAIN